MEKCRNITNRIKMPDLYIVLIMQLVLCEGEVYLFKAVLFSFPEVMGKQGNDSRNERMRVRGNWEGGVCAEPRLQDSWFILKVGGIT